MKVYEFLPSKNAASFISKFIYIESNLAEFSFKTIPRSYPAIFFVFPDEGILEIKIGNLYHTLTHTNIYFAGLGYHPSQIKFIGNVRTWVLMLKPEAAEIFFGDSAKSFINQIFKVTDTHLSFRFLAEQLWEQNIYTSESTKLMELFIIQNLKAPKLKPSLMMALNLIHNQNGTISIKELAKSSYTCNRNLLRQFDEYIGINPKTYSDMIRFSELMGILMTTAASLEELSFKFGYYDLSHLNKDAIRFLGESLHTARNDRKTLNQHMIYKSCPFFTNDLHT